MTKFLVGILAACVLALAGCSKKEAPLPQEQMDLQKFMQAFQNATPEQQANVTKVSFGLRYGQPATSLAALDALSNDASLTDQQKKTVAAMIEHVKQQATNAPAGGQ